MQTSSIRSKIEDELTSFSNLGLERKGIFISYAHEDTAYLTRLLTHFKPSMRRGLDVWSDLRLEAGQRWEVEIVKALASAKVAILLISADFLASDFIHYSELPPILEAENRRDLGIIPVILSASDYSDSDLGCYEAINDIETPLCKMPPGEQDDIWHKVINEAKKILKKT